MLGGLFDPAVWCICILILLIVLFVSRIIPIGVASILCALLTAAVEINTVKEVCSQFVNDIILLLVGVMIIGQAFFEVGLAQDIGNGVQKAFGNSEKKMLIALLFVVAILAGFISNTATVALFLPIIVGIEISSDRKITRQSMYMAISFAAVIGGNLTLFGSTPQLAVQAFLEQNTYDDVRPLSVFDLTLPTIPMILLLVGFYFLVGYKLQKKVFKKENLPEINGEVINQNEKKPLYKKVIVLLVYAFCIYGFVFSSLSVGIVAILGACACICLKCIPEKVAFKAVEWSSIFMLGGVLAISEAMSKSGAGQLVVDNMLNFIGNDRITGFAAYAIVIVCCILLTSVMSNTAVAVMMAPIAIELAHSLGANPMTFVIGVILASNISFCTPMATPPVAMTVDGGYRFQDYFVMGGLLTIVLGAWVMFGVPFCLGL